MNSLLQRLKTDFSEISFVSGDDFMWSPQEKVIYFALEQPDSPALLLHEVSHAVLEHAEYDRDIDLIKCEREAWEHAKNILAPKYDLIISEDTIEATLDTYRDWLHSRSLCPECGAVGMQVKKQGYSCVACHTVWRVNEARSCALRRYKE